MTTLPSHVRIEPDDLKAILVAFPDGVCEACSRQIATHRFTSGAQVNNGSSGARFCDSCMNMTVQFASERQIAFRATEIFDAETTQRLRNVNFAIMGVQPSIKVWRGRGRDE